MSYLNHPILTPPQTERNLPEGCSLIFLTTLIALQLAGIILRVTDVITWSWLAVLTPLWIYLGVGAI